MRTYKHKFTHAFYILPAVTLEWMERDAKKEYTLAVEWLKWGFYWEI